MDEIYEWPIYITDDGVVMCNSPDDCPNGDPINDRFNFSGYGRRTTFGTLVMALQEHIRDHG